MLIRRLRPAGPRTAGRGSSRVASGPPRGGGRPRGGERPRSGGQRYQMGCPRALGMLWSRGRTTGVLGSSPEIALTVLCRSRSCPCVGSPAQLHPLRSLPDERLSCF
jgi:hypothetical protein